MSDPTVPGAAGSAQPGPGEPASPLAGSQPVRSRVIGTPPPAQARSLLGATQDRPAEPAPDLPPGPADPDDAKRAERIVAALFILAMLAGIGFIAAYVGIHVGSVDATLHSNLALGGSLAVAFLALGVGATIWVRRIMPHVEITEQRHPMRSEPADRAAFSKTFNEGAQTSGFKRPLLRRTLMAATVPLVAAPIVLLRDLGPLPGTTLRHTVWRRGRRLLNYGPNTPIRPADFSSPGGMITVVPDGFQDDQNALAAAAAIIIKFGPGQLGAPTHMNWTVDDIVCYSKICTHVGCPAALYEETTHHILCPCHQSTFDAAHGALVTFGPAPRPLPQLPLTTDSEGYLVAASDFHEPIGPSFWERG